jgi:hypothetical protein
MYYINDEIDAEFILYNNNFMKDKLQKALNIVRDYIIEHNLIIVGGTAIDLSLRLHNTKIYNDLYQIPDYDIISPDNIKHANNLGELLCKQDFDNISIIPAIHHTTVRIQLLGFTLFDATYIPEYIYNKIPTLEYNEFRFVHPNFLKLNQYLSLSFLFKITGPSYNILNRLEKDIVRFELLEQYYNFKDFIKPLDNYKTNTFILKNNIYNINKLYNYEKYYEVDTNCVLNGVLVYNIIYNDYKELISKIDYKNNDIIKQLQQNITIQSNLIIAKDSLNFTIPDNIDICFLNNNNKIDDLINLLKIDTEFTSEKKYDSILDLIPKHYKLVNDINNIIIYDLYGDIPNIYLHKYTNEITLTSYTYNLLYFLTNYYFEEEPTKKNIYLHYYMSLKSIVDIIQYLYFNNNDELKKYLDFENSFYSLSINTLYGENYASNYSYFIENFKNLIKFNKNLSILPPKNYLKYPDCKVTKYFESQDSPYYNIDYKEINNTNDSNIILNK